MPTRSGSAVNIYPMNKLNRFGPGILVTAAFVGPGTITTASSAGANFGFALIWALVFSIFATIILQEMSARLGLVTREGLAEAMRGTFQSQFFGGFSVLLVVAAVGFGNAAYEAGNIAGASLAIASVTNISSGTAAVAIGVLSALLLGSGHYKILERALIGLVLVMSTVFILAAIMVAPAIGDLLSALFRPTMPTGSSLTVIALIGTTVVPYNLFLHANAVREKWGSSVPLDQALTQSRWDTGISIGLGGLITLAILATAATAFFRTGLEFNSTSMAVQLEPLLGTSAKYVFALGLFAGGLTSAITAPLAAAYAVCGAMGWPQGLRSPKFKIVWATVLLCGTVFAAIGTKPITAILFAQVANGFLLPVVAIFLLVVMNRRQLLGEHCNGILANILGVIVILVTTLLGAVKLLRVFDVL
jgi:manganese transport protein